MLLDTRTIVFMNCAVCAMIACLLFVAWRHNRDERTLCWWAGSYFMYGAACALFLPRGIIADILSVDLGNAVLFLGCGLGLAGARAFDGRGTPAWLIGAGAAIWLIACQVDVFYQSVVARIVLASVVFTAYSILVASEYWRGRADRLTSRYMLVMLHLSLATAFFLRIPMSFSVPPPSNFMEPNIWFAVSVLAPILIGIANAVMVVAVTKERAEERLRFAAEHDSLTGVLNRGKLMAECGAVLATGTKRPERVAVLVFDLDRFKQINDRFGHAAGDRALVAFTTIAASHLRDGDLFGRIGGEEFGAILPGAGEADALAVAERIRVAFARSRIEYAGAAFPVTVSVGVAAGEGGRVDIHDLIAEADRALYRAKDDGRDRVGGPLAIAS